MKEELLHFIWQYRHFSHTPLILVNNSEIQILSVGHLNSDSGPDFLNSKIILNGLVWVGSVEIHLKSSDWDKHGHHLDEAYNGVLLHVVWENDSVVYNQLGEEIPTLVLADYVDPGLIDRVEGLINNQKWIPCQKLLPNVDPIILIQFLERIFIERLQEKSDKVAKLLEDSGNNWDEVFYQLLCQSFGLKVNSIPMLQLSKLLPFKILSKHKDNLMQLEALLFGVSGFLNDPKDVYTTNLSKEFQFLKTKYGLVEMDLVSWKFLRMRPISFPTVRIAQLAALIHDHGRLFSKLINFENKKELEKIFDSKASDYWSNHYNFNKMSIFSCKKIGKQLKDNVLINSLVPLLFLYSRDKQDSSCQDKAISLMYVLSPEKNSYIKRFEKLGFKSKNEAQSQSFLHLKKHYCDRKKCLSCNIGNYLLSKC
jgi:hypothetical protein